MLGLAPSHPIPRLGLTVRSIAWGPADWKPPHRPPGSAIPPYASWQDQFGSGRNKGLLTQLEPATTVLRVETEEAGLLAIPLGIRAAPFELNRRLAAEPLLLRDKVSSGKGGAGGGGGAGGAVGGGGGRKRRRRARQLWHSSWA